MKKIQVPSRYSVAPGLRAPASGCAVSLPTNVSALSVQTCAYGSRGGTRRPGNNMMRGRSGTPVSLLFNCAATRSTEWPATRSSGDPGIVAQRVGRGCEHNFAPAATSLIVIANRVRAATVAISPMADLTAIRCFRECRDVERNASSDTLTRRTPNPGPL